MSASAEFTQPKPSIWSTTFAYLQRIGRSLMLPIAVLPAGAILLRLGQNDMLGGWDRAAGVAVDNPGGLHLASYDGFHWLQWVADVFGAAGNALFNNLGLIFAIGVAIGFAKKADGSTAVAALVGWLVFNYVDNTLLSTSSIKDQVVNNLDGGGTSINYLASPPYVLGGLAVGITAALLWQKFHRIKLPAWLAFFGGRRFVPIITALAAMVWGVVFGLIWPWVSTSVMTPFGNWLGHNSELGAGIYGVANRGLLPFGLHHVINSIVWFQVPDCSAEATKIAGHAVTANGDLSCYFAGVQGTGTFMAGFFPIMMFAVPAIALAITMEARPENRHVVGGMMLSGAVAAFVTGVTEPIEFAFLFVAPLLFVIHMVLTGTSMALMALLNVKIGFGFSAGLIDYVINFTKSNTHNPLMILVFGVIYFVVYFFLFRYTIRWLNLKTPGREEGDVDTTNLAA